MKKIQCPNCHTDDLDSDYLFCPKCAADLAPLQTRFNCCGHKAIIEMEANYCPACGSAA